MMLKKKVPVYVFAIVLLTVGSLSLTHASSPKVMSATTINVPDDYPTIQWAVGNASAGDTIFVKAGTYYENVVIAKSLTLKGAGSDITIIDGGGRRAGVKITADNVNVSGFTIRNSGDGVHLYGCNGVIVSSNKITLNINDGIYIQSSNNNTFRGNTITLNGISGLSIQYSSSNTIRNNVIASNDDEGIFLYDYSNNNTISGNTITSHVMYPAISLRDSDDNTMSNNTISNNKLGISFAQSYGNTIVGNTISNSESVGVDLFYSSGNTFHHNFINNTEQVTPSGTNAWDNGTEGNYWSDYNGTDADSDGIGDTPYKIDATNKDNHPLMNPYDETKPVADAGPDQLVVNGTTVTFDGSESTDNLGIANYTWTFTDNTTQVLTGVKANYTFGNIGNFSVTLKVSDYSGNWDTDKMWVNVTETWLIRDVAVTGITAFPTTVTTGDFLFINVTVANKGNMSETFNVIVYYNSSVVGTKNVISLASEANETLIFNWNTMGVPGGNYTTKAVASIVAGETYTLDNECTGDKVTVKRLSSSIYISASPANITAGASTTINGSISPIRVEVNVTIHYTFSGENWSVLENVTTDVDGRYSYEWTVTTVGTYEVKAGWLGDTTTLPAESDGVAVTVNMANSTISINVSSASVTVGSNITISGAISPRRAGVNVTIEYRSNGENWTTLATVTTDSEGEYSYDWKTTEPGSYEVKTTWEGDDNTLASESNLLNVAVREEEDSPTDDGSTTDIYAAAVAIIIIGSVATVYILKVRKPKPAHRRREQKL
jgi:nitrous oxidase accessory protein